MTLVRNVSWIFENSDHIFDKFYLREIEIGQRGGEKGDCIVKQGGISLKYNAKLTIVCIIDGKISPLW